MGIRLIPTQKKVYEPFKPTGHVMHIQQFYVLPTQCICVFV